MAKYGPDAPAPHLDWISFSSLESVHPAFLPAWQHPACAAEQRGLAQFESCVYDVDTDVVMDRLLYPG